MGRRYTVVLIVPGTIAASYEEILTVSKSKSKSKYKLSPVSTFTADWPELEFNSNSPLYFTVASRCIMRNIYSHYENS